MSTEDNSILVNLDPDEAAAIEVLRQEMGLDSPSEVMHLLVRQAQQRAAVVCPSCGHSASRTTLDEAKCAECMSVIQLTEGLWQVINLSE